MFVMETAVDLLTWDEFIGLPYETRNTDLVDGKMIVNSPNAQHERIVGNLLFALKLWQRSMETPLGQTTTQQLVKVNGRRGYQPDLSWFPIDQCAPSGQPFTGLPAIVVEVLSPSTRRFDLVLKRGDYERVGIAEFWIVDPKATQMLIARCPADSPRWVDDFLDPSDSLTSPLLPGFYLHVADLFTA